ncbi:alpha/beta fold hydrolase [Fluviispira vulneris]|uniref:alpha/beta fold hydrolase n=1 Tax=Fluviispira vulneris TaxID=2763012 RepID=UPI001647B28A|nr:alpha/beta fold hydrolase [Fluviispira vulneris]
MSGNKKNEEFAQIKNLKSHSTHHAEKAPGKFPVIFFVPGYGIPAQEYENIIIHLVSNGYIVIGLNSVFISGDLQMPSGLIANIITPDSDEQKNDLFNNSISDLAFSVSHLKIKNTKEEILNSIDWNKIALVGHSLGSSTIAHFAQKTKLKVKAIVTLDLTIDLLCQNNCPNLVNIPFMHIFSSQFYKQSNDKCFPFYCPPKNKRPSPDEFLFVVNNIYNDDSYSMHLSFTDYSTLQYHPEIELAIQSMLSKNPSDQFLGTGDGFTISQAVNKKILDFFQMFLIN